MRILLLLSIGMTVGGVSGALGIGGGVLLVPALIWLCEFEPKNAAGTSLAVLALPIVLPAAWKYYTENRVDLTAALSIAPAFMVGGILGASLIQHVPDNMVRLGFGLIMIYIAIRFMLSSSSEVSYAAAGLTAVALAWLVYLGLRALGRRHLTPPALGQQIHSLQQTRRGDIDYHI